MSGSPRPAQKRVRPLGQRKAAQNERILAHVMDPEPIDLRDIFPAKEVLGRNDKGAPVLPENIADRFRYIEQYHKPKTEVETKPGMTRPTRNADQKLNPYTEDFIFQTLHQLMLAGMPMDQIALKFDVSLSTCYKWRAKMIKRMADEVRSADPMPILGDALNTYKAIAAEGFRMMMTGRSAKEKRAGAEVALKANDSKMKTLQLAGFFDSPLLKNTASGGDDPRTQQANALMDMARSFMEGAPQLPAPDGTPSRQWSVPEGATLVDDDEDD